MSAAMAYKRKTAPLLTVGKVKSQSLTLRDVLSRLTFAQASKLLGPEGRMLLKSGAVQSVVFSDATNYEITDERFEIEIDKAKVVFELKAPNKAFLSYHCSSCHRHKPLGCEHVAAALLLILDEKVALGLAIPPPEKIPLEKLSEEALVERAIAERRERVQAENLTVTKQPAQGVWGDYQVDNPKSGRSYRVSIRGWEKGKCFCECPDFKVNTLGLCKHTMAVTRFLEQKGKNLKKIAPWEPREIEVYLDYSQRPPALRAQWPPNLPKGLANVLEPWLEKTITDVQPLVQTIKLLEKLGHEPIIFPDALSFIELALHREELRRLTEEIRSDPANHIYRENLLKVPLLPYQMDGVAFAAGAGRAIIADDMGLGKTIQGVGLAVFLAKTSGIEKVLIICPASLKSQWRDEIQRFCDRSVGLVLGQAHHRREQYSGKTFFTICNYEQILRDRAVAKLTDWDLIILDEAQRVKNWESASHRAVAELNSRFFLALTGTPMENSLDELYTLVKLVDNQLLGPAFRFLNTHKQTDERGRLLSWQGLNAIKASLGPIFLRRTRAEVLTELPPREVSVFPVEATEEQLEIHNHHIRMVTRVIKKPFLTEMDFLRLKKHLLKARLAANSASLVDYKSEGVSGKFMAFESLMERLLAEGRKILVFSEWTGTLDLAEARLTALGESWIRLDGSIPQARRQALIEKFTNNPKMRVFLATNAGSTGLNLQAADTIVNLDLPWNPAIIEQRIGRAHRLGQTKPVQAFLLVTKDTIEERLLDLLGAKSALALAALDLDSDVDEVAMSVGVDALKQRLEILLGRQPDKAMEDVEGPARRMARRQRVMDAGEKLKNAALELFDSLIDKEAEPSEELEPSPKKIISDLLETYSETDSQNRRRLVLPVGEVSFFENVVGAIGQIIGHFFR
ncbi:MAG: DEAD/DEAH box helicase [Deltaproteobacteria bacterium]|jgi:superfamily II DNA or RNA helicase|nr:DEAD/DEAH box helicase [Deltaproteobacteria bacterium]